METKATFKDYMLYGIAASFVFSVMLYFFIISFIPHQNDNSVTQIIPILTGALGTVFGFLYGSSVSAKSKDDTINNLTNKGKSE